MSESNTTELDLRQLPPPQRHARIFATWGSLPVGHAMRIVNDHDPKPLYYQLQAEHAGEFSWEYEQAGPEDWRVLLTRTKLMEKQPVSALYKKVSDALDQIRPMLQADGGDVDLIDVTDNGIVKVELQGACDGCPMAQVTLSQGIERQLIEMVPEVKRVFAGSN